MTTAWAHLPNARHIDAVLADVKARPEAWGAARDPAWDAAWDSARDTARDSAQSATLNSARSAAREVALDSALDSALGSAQGAAWGAVWDAIAALIAWDSSADLLECTPDVLSAMIDLAEPPVCHQAALLMPYAIVRFGK